MCRAERAEKMELFAEKLSRVEETREHVVLNAYNHIVHFLSPLQGYNPDRGNLEKETQVEIHNAIIFVILNKV